MAGDGRNLTCLLKDELRFIELGGYDWSKREAWYPKSIFQDSLTCPNFGLETRSHSCKDCHLFNFVELEHRSKDVPCHFIALTDSGETIADLQSANSVIRLKRELKRWLRWEIYQIELENAEVAPAQL